MERLHMTHPRCIRLPKTIQHHYHHQRSVFVYGAPEQIGAEGETEIPTHFFLRTGFAPATSIRPEGGRLCGDQ